MIVYIYLFIYLFSLAQLDTGYLTIIIVLVKSNYGSWSIKKSKKNLYLLKLDLNPFLPTKHCKYGRQSSLLVGYNIQPSSSSTNQNTALIIDH